MTNSHTKKIAASFGLALLAIGIWLFANKNDSTTHQDNTSRTQLNNPSENKPHPALTVISIRPIMRELPLTVTANGDVAAWQEAMIGAEVNGLRINQVLVNVGDRVKKGQLLASFANETLLASLAQTEASLKEALAQLQVAKLNAQRARDLTATGALSQQEIDQLLSTESVAVARVDIAKANINSQRIQLSYSKLTAPDDGIISSRSASVGQVASAGVELFKLIRQSRLEWRAEVTSSDLSQVKIGDSVNVVAANGAIVQGQVRSLAPTINQQTRNALVYVDLPTNSPFKAGMYAKGEFNIGNLKALVIPQQALVLRDGFQYVFVLSINEDQNKNVKQTKAKQTKVKQTKVQIGRRFDNLIEITDGLNADQQLVATGAAFLSDGDTVSVTPEPKASN